RSDGQPAERQAGFPALLSQRPLFQAGPEATGIRASDRRTISSSRSSTTPSTMPPVARRREVVTPRCPIATPQGPPLIAGAGAGGAMLEHVPACTPRQRPIDRRPGFTQPIRPAPECDRAVARKIYAPAAGII